MDSKYSFLDQEPPPGYVAGIGRGATGFTTVLDVGGLKLSTSTFLNGGEDDHDDDERYLDLADDDAKGLLLVANANDEDDELDRIYDEIELRMKLRRKRKLADDPDGQGDSELPIDQIREQFQDLKQALVTVSEQEWLNLPEAMDLTKRNKRQRQLLQEQQRTYAVPDSVLEGMQQQLQLSLTNEVTDFRSISLAKDKLLGLQLDSGLSVAKSDSVDLEAYSDALEGMSVANVGNVAKLRAVLSNLRKSEPKKPSGWIALARLEESVKRFEQARSIIQEGCDVNPLNDELWLENLRLLKPQDKKPVIRQLLTFQPKSVSLWLALSKLELDLLMQKRVLRKLIENVPTSVSLWETSVELETQVEEKKKLLVKLCELTNDIGLWLKLIDSETDVKLLRKYLNDARKLNPESLEIWIHLAKLEERTTENEVKITKLLTKGIKDVPERTRDEYMKLLAQLDLDGFPLTCNGILVNVLEIGLEDQESSKLSKLLARDARAALNNGLVHMAKSIYQYILQKFPNSLSIWKLYLSVIKTHDPDQMPIFFQQLIDLNPEATFLWLWYAKEQWTSGNLEESSKILLQLTKLLPNDEEILFLRIKLQEKQLELGQDDITVEKLYNSGLEEIGSLKVYYRYVTFLRLRHKDEALLEVCSRLLDLYPECFKLYLQKSQIYQDKNDIAALKEALKEGTLALPGKLVIWLNLCRLEESSLRRRAILDKLLLQCEKDGNESALIWRERFRLEVSQDKKQAQMVLARLLKACPHSPELWCEKLMNLERKSLQKTSFKDAMVLTQDHPLVLNTIGFMLWKDGKINRCKNFFDKSIELNKDIGDSWVLLYLFLTRHGDPEEIEKLVVDIEELDPHHGELWCSVTKKLTNVAKSKKELLDECVSKLNK